MKSIYEIRRENLITLIRENFDGRQKQLADAIGIGVPSFISRLVSVNPRTAQNIGGKLARKIEAIPRKPENWLDYDHSRQGRAGTPAADHKFDADLLVSCMDQVRVALMHKKIPRTDKPWLEIYLLGMAWTLYRRMYRHMTGESAERRIKKEARDIVTRATT